MIKFIQSQPLSGYSYRDHPVAVVAVVVVMNLFTLLTSLRPLHRSASNYIWMLTVSNYMKVRPWVC